MFWSVADNSGVKVARQLKIQKTKKAWAEPGDMLTVFPRKFKYKRKITRQKYVGLVITTKRNMRRQSYWIRCNSNNILILNPQHKFLGSRIFSPLCKEVQVRHNSYIYKRIYARTGRFI
jgi:ribosomal protein L14